MVLFVYNAKTVKQKVFVVSDIITSKKLKNAFQNSRDFQSKKENSGDFKFKIKMTVDRSKSLWYKE